MRGALIQTIIIILLVRIIPADAGSTKSWLGIVVFYRDHPRGCGEHSARRLARLKAMGSSPRMRGAQIGLCLSYLRERIIPADAGSTAAASKVPEPGPDHPRGCGEHLLIVAEDKGREGSSPRMRGAHRQQPVHRHRRRIIPADAGSTTGKATTTMNLRDHPRGCGEHSATCAGKTSRVGSSPRMRGAPDSHG